MSNEAVKIVIEKGVPVPAKMPRKRASKYPFYEMDIGDSFFIENPRGTEDAANRLRNAAHRFCSQFQGYKFSIRSVIEGEALDKPRVRVWRVA